MLRFILRRAGVGLAQIFVTLTLIFFAVRMVPGDPAETLASAEGGSSAVTPERLAQIRESLGLDKPLLVQYWDNLTGLLTGNMGYSFEDGTAVTANIAQRLPNTAEIVVLAALIGVLVGLVIGSWSGRGGHVSQLIGAGLTSAAISVPVYILGSVLVLVFALKLGWFPTGGYAAMGTDPAGHLSRLVLPALTLATPFAAIVARMTASSVREVSTQDWVRTARSLGLGGGRVFREDVLRNALNPVVTVVGLEMGLLLGSTVLVERVFSWPGLGSLLVDAVAHRDYPIVQGVTIVIATAFILINTTVDLIYGLLDPRIRR